MSSSPDLNATSRVQQYKENRDHLKPFHFMRSCISLNLNVINKTPACQTRMRSDSARQVSDLIRRLLRFVVSHQRRVQAPGVPQPPLGRSLGALRAREHAAQQPLSRHVCFRWWMRTCRRGSSLCHKSTQNNAGASAWFGFCETRSVPSAAHKSDSDGFPGFQKRSADNEDRPELPILSPP